MAIVKRKKNSRQRGTHTHGWGSKKKHRGAGSRGGHGGTGKRGDSLKPSVWKNNKYFGKYGFKSINAEKIEGINIGDIQNTIGTLVKKGCAQEKSGAYDINLGLLGYNKLLGSGKVTAKFNIKVKFASAKAVEKVKKAGGNVEIEVTAEPSEKVSEDVPAPKEKPKEVEQEAEEKPKENKPDIKSPEDIIKEVKGQ